MLQAEALSMITRSAPLIWAFSAIKIYNHLHNQWWSNLLQMSLTEFMTSQGLLSLSAEDAKLEDRKLFWLFHFLRLITLSSRTFPPPHLSILNSINHKVQMLYPFLQCGSKGMLQHGDIIFLAHNWLKGVQKWLLAEKHFKPTLYLTFQRRT